MIRSLSAALLLAICVGCSSDNTASNGTIVIREPAKQNSTNESPVVANNETNTAPAVNPPTGDSKVTEQNLEVPFYPGSQNKEGSDFKIDSSAEKIYMSIRTTDDDPRKVANYYLAKVKGSAMKSQDNDQTSKVTVEGKLPSGANFSMFALREKAGLQTEINIAVTSKPK